MNKMNSFFFYSQEIRFRAFYFFLCIFLTLVSGCLEMHPILFYFTIPLGGLKIVLTDLPDVPLAMFSLAVNVSGFLSYPILLYHLWAFIVPALIAKERSLLNWWISLSLSLFFLTILFCFIFIFPQLIQHFFLTQVDLFLIQVQCLPTLLAYIHTMTGALFAVFVFSQVFAFFLFIVKNEIVPFRSILKERKLIFFCILLISAFLSPPDILSQLSLSFFCFCIYEMIVFNCLWYEFKNKTFKETNTKKKA